MWYAFLNPWQDAQIPYNQNDCIGILGIPSIDTNTNTWKTKCCIGFLTFAWSGLVSTEVVYSELSIAGSLTFLGRIQDHCKSVTLQSILFHSLPTWLVFIWNTHKMNGVAVAACPVWQNGIEAGLEGHWRTTDHFHDRLPGDSPLGWRGTIFGQISFILQTIHLGLNPNQCSSAYLAVPVGHTLHSAVD